PPDARPEAPREPPEAETMTVPPVAMGAGQGSLDLWSAVLQAPPGLEASTERLHAVRARAIHGLAILPLAVGADARAALLVGIALAARDGTTCYVPLRHEGGGNFTLARVREWLAPAFA